MRLMLLAGPLIWACSAVACNDDAASKADTAIAETVAETGTETTPETVAETTPETVAETTAETATETVTETTEETVSGCVPGVSTDCQNVQWLQVGDFPTPSDHHTTMVHVDASGVARLYVMGGVWQKADGSMPIFDNVRRATIGTDHLLGAWEDEAALPDLQGMHGMATSAEHIYLVAGISTDADGVYATNAVYVGSFDPAGHLTFTTAVNHPTARVHPTIDVVGQRLIVIGGSRQTPIDSVMSAPLAADGSVGVWTDDATLPTARSHHATVVRNGRIWVFGGFDAGMTPVADILVSVHDADGRVTGWEVAGHMDKPPWTHGATLYKDGVLLIGGGEGGPDEADLYYVDRVRFARWDADGVLGDFVDLADPLPRARSHVHQDPIYDGYIYSIAGRLFSTGASMSEVYVGYLAW